MARNSRRSSKRDKSISCGGEFDDDDFGRDCDEFVRDQPTNRKIVQQESKEKQKKLVEEAELAAVVNSVDKRIRERGRPTKAPMVRSQSVTGPAVVATAQRYARHKLVAPTTFDRDRF